MYMHKLHFSFCLHVVIILSIFLLLSECLCYSSNVVTLRIFVIFKMF